MSKLNFANFPATMNDPRAYYHEESSSERLSRKSKEVPFFPIGMRFFLFYQFSSNEIFSNWGLQCSCRLWCLYV